jgi:SecD/SecF fusion protein
MKRPLAKVALILLTALVLGFIDLPAQTQQKIFSWTPKQILDSKFQLGLDLQGGSQLDYKIDLRNVPEKDQSSIIEGVLNVINNRVNGLGVSEPNIYVSSVGNEKHLVVELAGIKDLEKAKEIVGKTIQLEFKEKRETEDPKAAENAKKDAQVFLDKVKSGSDIKVLGQEEKQASPAKVTYEENKDFQFQDDLPKTLGSALFGLKVGQTYDKLLETNDEYAYEDGNLVPIKGYNIIKLLEKQDKERTIEHKAEAKVSHILIAYKGAEKADAGVTRSQEEAKKRADEVLEKLKKGEKFEDLAKTYSDDQSNKEKGGVIEDSMPNEGFAKEFSDASVALKKKGDLSPITKTAFGFHIIKANEVKEASTEKKVEPQIKYVRVFFSSKPDQWQETGLTGKQFAHADAELNPNTYQPVVSIQFNDEGAKLFEKITEKNVGKPLAIFVGGEMITNPPPNVSEKISGGKATISGSFTLEEAIKMARDLNTGAIPAPITLAGQNTIGATLGQDALQKSLWAGMIGFLLVALFMILYYRLPGFLATLALAVYSVILLFLIKVSIPLYWSLAIAIAIFIAIVMKILSSRDSGAEKGLSLVLGCFILFFLSFLLSTSVVMTLAGIAGVILSIGMAVDANILIFERIKEELRDGKTLTSAIETGFNRAWSSIRDSNFSSLITCGILYYFGSSIIQGFAFNLAAGILVSMFTAITVTKTLLLALSRTRLSQNLWLFGAPKKKDKKLLPVIQTRKISYVISVVLLIAALVGIPIFGLKLGLDFTGGTLMEIKPAKKISIEELKKGLEESARAVNAQITKEPAKPETKPATTPETKTDDSKQTTLENPEEKIDMGQAHIIPSEQGYIIKSKHISTAAHDLFIPELKKKIGDFEEIRFNTVGPTVGESLRYRAVMAVIVASIMIVLYIAFAFRRIPRSIGKWKFGVAAIFALLHDLGIMLGIYVYFGAFFGVEIDALFITALLTILGFSVHDTIVVFDRIREKLKFQKRDETFADVTNQAINETIGRSINTSLAVFLTLLAMAIFGSESIRFFILSLIIGIVAGTYSSIFIASPILVDWQEYQRKKASGLLAGKAKMKKT